MTLAPSTRIGNYEILAPLGAGGMGEVYRARDTRLDRQVAIKALPQEFHGDRDRLARFEREAKLLASLNHPNIAAIYGLEDAQGACHLVLELVGGETLGARLRRGALSVRETIEVGSQIAAAIEAAHERGIVHRDLKPGNVMLTPSGTVKVLDFGLAKDVAPEAPTALSMSPTAPMPATAEGVVVGTAPYMSPEQLRGKPVDRRTDVWALGCILFESLTAHPAFSGETRTDVVVQVLQGEPDWSALPAAVPTRLRDLMRRCLTKAAADRPRDIGDLGRELSAIAAEKVSGTAPTADLTARPSLAVLYFANLAKDPESEYFCEGITEDILTDLSKIKGIRVASRNAVMRFRGAPADLHAVAAELGVNAVLEGSVRRVGDRVRITTQLVSAVDGFQLWAERYDRTLQDVFAVQEEIASSIARALRVALTPAEVEGIGKDRPQDARAYDLYLKGRAEYSRYRPETFVAALALFRQAIAIDPGYALAWAGIGDCCAQLIQCDSASDEDLVGQGLDAARRAVTLDPRLAEGHKAEALLLRMSGDSAGERKAIARAIEANPRHTPALVNSAVGRFTDADLAGTERTIRRVLEIDPQDVFATNWLANLFYVTGRWDECIATVDRVRQVTTELFFLTIAESLRVECFLARDDLDAAQAALRRALSDGAEPRTMRCTEAAIAARTGREDEARRWLRELDGGPLMGSFALITASGVLERLGEPELALRFLNRNMIRRLVPTLARLIPALYPLLDRPPLAPRRRAATLVWPLEAPRIDAARHSLFREVRIESGIPQASDLLGPASE